MKKILSLILAGLMTVSCAAFVAADDAAVEATNAEEAFAISFLAEQGIYHGKSAEEFVAAAADPIERWQMALFVGRISTGWVDDYMWDYNYDWEDNNANNSTFTDLEGTAAADYLGAISYANQMGIIEGYSATKFGPTDGITYRDALTMVVRTMGYKNLMYPWGYIEKAVELGLTEGVTATYTTPLNRGQVAVILYNAMFAPTKSGETLAKSIFDVDFGWETIVITATDEAGFANNGKRAAKNYVGFNLIDAAGNIDAKTYYVAKTDLGLENGHDDELAIGYIYDALFTIDGDLATIVKADKHDYEEIVNNGRTDNAGEEVATQPIKAYLDKYSLVKERVGKEYLTFLGQELYIYEKGVYEYFVDTDAALVGIEWGTNNIVKWDETAGEDEKGDWVVEWLYNETLNKYYRYEFSEVDEVYVDWMSDAEFEEWYAEASKIRKEESQYVLKTALVGAADTAYAKLVAFDLDADEAAEVALYKDYAIGYFTNDSKKCGLNKNNVNHDHDTKYPTYKITTLDGAEVLNEFVEADHVAHDMNDLAGLDKVGNGFVWFNVADDVTGFENEDGSFNKGTVLYNWDKLTGEIEVVKYIPESGEGMDDDSYWVKGVLQGYSTANTYITVDGQRLYYGYDKLSGVSQYLKKGDNNVASRTVSAEKLDTLLMQYVKVLVVDGLVVDVDLLNQDANNVIVVYDYAGITSDGYIAVYGYSTKDATLSIFKINSYNGWKKGDYRYNPDLAINDDAFVPGTLYAIKSFDADTNSYGVETYDWTDYYTTEVTMKFESGYRIFVDANNELVYDPAKTANSDTYIFVTPNGEIFVTTGDKVDPVATAKGDILYRDGGKTVMLANAANISKFAFTSHEVGFVLYDEDISTVLEAAYDDAQDVEDYYLLGSTVSSVRVFNLLTGKYDYVFASTNIDLEDGQVYKTIGNTVIDVVDDATATDAKFVDAIHESYCEPDVDYAKYIVPVDNQGATAKFVFKGDEALTKLDIAKALGVINPLNKESVQKKIAEAYVTDIRWREVAVTNGNVDIEDATLVADETYTAKVVYNVADKVAIVYIYAADTVGADVTEDLDLSKMENMKMPITVQKWTYTDENNSEVEVELRANVTMKTKSSVKGGAKTLKGIILDTITLEFVDVLTGKAIPHEDLVKAGYVFGNLKDHDNAESFFFFNDSNVVSDTFGEIANAGDMTFTTLGDCNAVGKVEIAVEKEYAIAKAGYVADEVVVGIVGEDGVGNYVRFGFAAHDLDKDGVLEPGKAAASEIWFAPINVDIQSVEAEGEIEYTYTAATAIEG